MENNLSIDYLRFSLTDRCNLNCIYCTPAQRKQSLNAEDVLSYEEMTRMVSLLVKSGMRKVRLTGGEPLIKKDIAGFIQTLSSINGLEEISMTTNGVYLSDMARSLKKAHLSRVNISIDTLQKEKFKFITGSDHFDAVWQGIQSALKAGLSPVKLNVVLMRGINDDEIIDFVKLAFDYPLIVRFIEFFPTNKRTVALADSFITTEEVKRKIVRVYGELKESVVVKGNGPAKYYGFKGGALGAVGFISGCSDDFCASCNRVRIDSSGKIRLCLFSEATHDLRYLLKSIPDERMLTARIQEIFKLKRNYRKIFVSSPQIEMSAIGG